MPKYKKTTIPIPSISIQNKIVSGIQLVESLKLERSEKMSKLMDKLDNDSWFSYDTNRIEKIATMVQRGKGAKYGASEIQIVKSE